MVHPPRATLGAIARSRIAIAVARRRAAAM
jgi:hypothetical protein